jgi:hypothetical protein
LRASIIMTAPADRAYSTPALLVSTLNSRLPSAAGRTTKVCEIISVLSMPSRRNWFELPHAPFAAKCRPAWPQFIPPSSAVDGSRPSVIEAGHSEHNHCELNEVARIQGKQLHWGTRDDLAKAGVFRLQQRRGGNHLDRLSDIPTSS